MKINFYIYMNGINMSSLNHYKAQYFKILGEKKQNSWGIESWKCDENDAPFSKPAEGWFALAFTRGAWG